MPRLLCRQGDLSDPGSLGFEFERTDARPLRVFLVQYEGQVFGYRNSCPHTGATMEWQADRFLDYDERFIQCGVHGAIFRIEDGACLHGPCVGSSLEPMVIECRNAEIWMLDDDF